MRRRWPVLAVCLAAVLTAGTFLARPYLHGQATDPPAPAAQAAPREPTSYRDLVKKVLPAVVSVDAKTKAVRVRQKAPGPRRNPRFDQLPEEFRKQLPDDLRKFFEEHKDMPFGPFPMPEEFGPRQGFGSGFLVDPKGVVLTNFHVVDGAEEIVVQLHDGRKFTSKDVKGDRKTDLAVVRLDLRGGKDLPYLELGDSEAMHIGDRVLAFGAPFGLTGSVTHGIVSGKGRAGFGLNMYEDFLQTDAAINPGNSGGPLVNLEGKVVGINSMIKSRSGGFQGVGLAISSNLARNVMQALIKDGVVHRGYLGVQIRDLSEDVAAHLGLKDRTGVVVAEVFDNAPAKKAGLQAGDIITTLGGKAVKDGRGLQTVVAGLPLGKAVAVTVLRDGKTLELQVTIEEQPNEFGVARNTPPARPEREPRAVDVGKVGVEVADLTAEMAEEVGYAAGTRGAVIMRVEPGSAAASAGMRQGMLISKVGNRRVDNAAAAREALEKASLERGVLLQVQSPQGGTNYVLLQQQSASAGN